MVVVAPWWSSEGAGTAAPRRAVPQGRGEAGAAHVLLLQVSISHLPGSVIVPETLALPLCPQVSPVASAIRMDMAQMPDDSRQENVTV